MNDYWQEVKNGPKTAAPPQTKVLVPTNEALIRKVNASASTLWFVTVVSVINLVLVHIGGPIRFAFGLEMTDLIYAVGHAASAQSQTAGSVVFGVALVMNLFVLGGTAALGWCLKKYQEWAFVVSLILIVADLAVIGWITMKTADLPIVEVLVHCVLIYSLWMGMTAAKLYNTRRKSGDAI